MKNGFRVLDSDSHVIEPHDRWGDDGARLHGIG